MSEKKILVIEDDTFLAKMLVRALEATGNDIAIATTGEDGLRRVESNGYDLVLLDIMLPDIDGFEILQKMRSKDATKKTPVIIMSNLGQPEDIDRGKQLGATDYVVKSDLSLDDVVAKANQYLSKKK
jgi:DNA-binding response OmpR family regulator